MAGGWLLLGGIAAVAYLVATRKNGNGGTANGCPPGYHRMPDGTCMLDAAMPGGGAPAGAPGAAPVPGALSAQDILPPELLALYQAIIYGHGSALDCQRLKDYLGQLEPESADEASILEAVSSQVQFACSMGPISLSSNLRGFTPMSAQKPLPDFPLPSGLDEQTLSDYITCWYGCSAEQLNSVTSRLKAFADGLDTRAAQMHPDDPRARDARLRAAQARYASQQLWAENFGTSGVPHVGDCGCEACKAKHTGDDEEPCCEACARGVGACSCTANRQREEDRYTSGVA